MRHHTSTDWHSATANIELFPKEAPCVTAKGLVVLDQAVDLRCHPNEVQAPDDQVLVFKTCHKTLKNFTVDMKTNDSVDAINVCSYLYKNIPDNVQIPCKERIVIEESSPDNKDSTRSVDWSEDPQAMYQRHEHHAETLVAGLLVTYRSDSGSLADLLKAKGESPTTNQ